MSHYSPQYLRVRLALPFVALVVVGSIALVAGQQVFYAGAQRRELRTVAEANASFLRSTAFPPSAKLAENLGSMLHALLAFRRGPTLLAADVEDTLRTALLALPSDGRTHPLPGARIGLALKLDGEFDLLLARPAVSVADVLRDPLLRAGLAGLWAMALALGLLLSRGIVRPLRVLAQALPTIGEDTDVTLPGLERRDEIGLLARSFTRTRALLREERERRGRAERLSLLGRMATALAHEIQNPLAAIRLHTQLLQATPAGERDAQFAQSLPHLAGALDRASSLVHQWLFLARPDPPRRSPVDLDALLDETLRALQPLFAHSGVEVRRAGAVGLRVLADPRRMAHVVQNLATNAVQAMGGRGTLDVATAREGGEARIVFRDSGPGFSPEALRRGTEMLYTEKEGGLGVGLTVCEEVVRGHGGRLELANGPDGGARVAVVLPLAPGDVA